MSIFRRLKGLLQRRQQEESMAEEIRLHLEYRTNENIAAGMDPTGARDAANRRFGNVALVSEQARIQRGWNECEQLWRDVRFALRSLFRARGFTAVSILTLALGMGAAAAIFSVADKVLFGTTNYPQDIFLVGGQNDNTTWMPYRWDYMTSRYESETQIFSETSKSAILTGNIVLDGQPVSTGWNGVSANFFSMLSIAPLFGRGFREGEDMDGADQVVVVSYKFWQDKMGGRPDVLGKTIIVGQAVCEVVGVLRKSQTLFPFTPNEVFRPLTYKKDPATPWEPYLYFLGRLRTGVSQEQAQLGLRLVKIDVPALAQPYYFNDRPMLSSLVDVNRYFRPEIYWLLLGASGVLYAIACLNASNLMLARFLSRHRELSIRLALGGGGWRIIRLLAAETATLVLFASVAAVLFANLLLPLLQNVSDPATLSSGLASWNLDVRALGILALLATASGLLVVAVPAFRVLRTDIYSSLRDASGAAHENPFMVRLRGSLVVVQAAFAIVLLAGAGLMIHTIHRLQTVDLGFDPTDRVKVQLGFPLDYPNAPEARLARLRELQSELMRIPGVRAVGFGMDVMLPGYYLPTYHIEGTGNRTIKAACFGFSVGYHEAAGLKLKRGKWLSQAMGDEVLVNESFAQSVWPNEDPIGKFVRPTGGSSWRDPNWRGWIVAGVVGNVRSTVREQTENHFYGPEGWGPDAFKTFIVRGSDGNGDHLADIIRRRIYGFDPRITVDRITPFSSLRGESLWAEQLTNSILKVLAGIALALTAIGLFSVLTYTVERRMAEFGVRLALGATRRHLAGLVVRRAMQLTLTGVILGVCGACASTRYIENLLFETTPYSAWVLGAVGGLVLATTTVASLLPVIRAANVDVTKLLKSE